MSELLGLLPRLEPGYWLIIAGRILVLIGTLGLLIGLSRRSNSAEQPLSAHATGPAEVDDARLADEVSYQGPAWASRPDSGRLRRDIGATCSASHRRGMLFAMVTAERPSPWGWLQAMALDRLVADQTATRHPQ